MKKIAIALILFQLIGCAKQPAITTNQKDIKDIHLLQAKIETIEKERESYANEIFWNSVGAAVGIGIGVIAIIASVGIVINNRKSTNELTSEMEQLKQKVDKSQTTLKTENIEAINKKVEETEKNTNTITQELTDLREAQQGSTKVITALQDAQNSLQDVQNELRNEFSNQQNALAQDIPALKNQQKGLQDQQNKLQEIQSRLEKESKDQQNKLRTEFGVRQNALEEQLTGLKSQQATLQKAHTELQQKDTAIEERIKENTKALNTRINATNGKIEDVIKKVTALDSLVLRVQQNLVTSQNILHSKQDELEAQLKALREAQNGLEANLNTFADNQQALNEHQNQLEAQQNKFQEIQKTLEDAQEALISQQELNKLQKQHATLEQRVNTLTTEFRIAEQKQRKFEDQVQESQTALKQATQETMATCIDARTKFESEQDAQDIDRIVQSSAERMRYYYPGIEGDILQVYPDKGRLEAILKWYLLQPVPRGTIGARPGETNLSYHREYVKRRLDEEVEIEQRTHPERPMPVLFIKIERHEWCLIGNINQELLRIQDYLEKLGEGAKTLAPFAITYTARIVYYYEFKEALIGNNQ